MAKTALMYDDRCQEHTMPAGHPERPARMEAIQSAFQNAKLDPPRIDAIPAEPDDICRVHTEAHVEKVRDVCESGGRYPDRDTPMMSRSFDVALLAAGGAIEAAKAVANGDYANVFSAMRPPGHHAERDRAMGFCLFNNVAVATRWLQARLGAGKIAILDWDVHHGNGTQHTFYDDASVYYISLHEFPHYPGTGLEEERGQDNTNLNIHMAAGAKSQLWLDAIDGRVRDEIDAFDPEFLFISCGFDAHENDPLSEQNVSTDDYATMTQMVKGLAGGRVISLLEGGYDLDALGESAVAHVRALGE